jgi:5-methyltetrahydrofolate--homocysteine methyltransferase
MPDMVELVKEIRAATDLPILAQANAGDPQIVNGETVYTETADNFAAWGPALREAGAQAIGACCGSTPEFIKALAAQLK